MFEISVEQASKIAPRVDLLNDVITWLSLFFTVAIVGVMIYFAIRYRKREGVDHETPQIRGSSFLEVVWTVIPTIIVIFIGYYGIVIFHDMREVPEDAMTINVTGKKWDWTFDYEGKKKTFGEFVVPVNKPIRLVLTSSDVIHSLFIPAMRVKVDAVPGMYTYLSFTPVKVGDYHVFCTEYCGLNHSQMLARLHVVSAAEFDLWIQDTGPELSGVERGRQLYTEQGCIGCHSLDGSRLIGPSFLKLYNREGELVDGAPYIADETYLRDSILDPNSQIVKGYPAGQMVVYQDLMSEEELTDLISFIKTVDGSAPIEKDQEPSSGAEEDLSSLSPVERGEKIYRDMQYACVTCHSLDETKLVGPSLKGIWERKGKLQTGDTYIADGEYLKRAILNSNSEIVEGFQPVMPPFEGRMSDKQVQDLIEFLKTVE